MLQATAVKHSGTSAGGKASRRHDTPKGVGNSPHGTPTPRPPVRSLGGVAILRPRFLGLPQPRNGGLA